MALRSVGVVGAGTMGSGIAQKAATEGVPVTLVDVNEAALDRGMSGIRKLLDQGVDRGVFGREEADRVLGRLRPSTRLEDLGSCELVIEAVPEDFDLKWKVFDELERVCRSDALLATNTSSFRVADLQEERDTPERILGLHYFYHPAKNRLVEVVAGPRTDESVRRVGWQWMEALGKTPIGSADSPAFVVNRFFVPWLNEAVRLLEEGDATEAQIDRVARESMGIGMGPFELMNATGPAVALHAANTLGEAFGRFYTPAGRLERVGGGGERWRVAGSDEVNDEAVRGHVAARLHGAAWLAAGQLVDEGVTDETDADLGARVGLRWRKGPFELANELGIAHAARTVRELAREWNLEMPSGFAARLETGDRADEPFRIEQVRAEIRDDVAVLTLYRPDQMNVLSPDLLADLETAWDRIAADDGVRSVVLQGAGKAFMAGADLSFFVGALDRKDLTGIRRFTERAAMLYDRIDRSDKRIVAVLDGVSLGGGSELALCADALVATDRGSLGFPETGIGIYPALGGTQRTTRRTGRPVARWLVLTGKPVDAETARALGLVERLVERDEALDEAIGLGRSEDALPHAEPHFGHPLMQTAQRLLDDAEAPAWIEGRREPNADDEAAKELQKRLSRKAPIALRTAASLIDRAERDGDVRDGLSAELRELETVFETRDADEGLRAALEQRRPRFEGR